MVLEGGGLVVFERGVRRVLRYGFIVVVVVIRAYGGLGVGMRLGEERKASWSIGVFLIGVGERWESDGCCLRLGTVKGGVVQEDKG